VKGKTTKTEGGNTWATLLPKEEKLFKVERHGTKIAHRKEGAAGKVKVIGKRREEDVPDVLISDH